MSGTSLPHDAAKLAKNKRRALLVRMVARRARIAEDRRLARINDDAQRHEHDGRYLFDEHGE